MERVVYDYKILSGENVSDLEGQVRSHIQLKRGWDVGGSLLKDGNTFYQTIVRVKED